MSVSQIYDEASYNYILHVNKVIKENNLIDNYNERKIKYEEFRDKKIHLIEKEKEEDNKRYLELCEEYLNIFAKKVYDYINTANSGELVENIQYEIFRGNLSSEYKKNNNRPLYIIIYTTLTKTEKYYNHFVASLDGKSTKSCMSAYLFKSKKEYKEVEKKLKEKPRCKYFILKIEEEHGHLICH